MITADHSGLVTGQFTIPASIPAGVKNVEFIGDRGTRGVTQFIGRGEIRIEERRRVRVVQRYDPLAQTFTLLTEGRHISSIGLWFEDVGTKAITVQIRETSTGIPTGIVLTETRITIDDIAAPGEETIISFATPLYLDALTEFAIVILTDDNTHSLAIAEVGQYDKRAKTYVTEQGYTVGVLLSSSNASTWTPHNNADLAFRIYAAEFTATTYTVPLKTITANNASDAYIMADIERTGAETDAFFTLTDASARQYRLQDGQATRLDMRTTGDITTSATLMGSSKRSPVIYPGTLAAMGDLTTSANYISRYVTAGVLEAIVVLETNIPSGASIKVEIEIDSVWHVCSPENGEPIGDGWVRNEYKKPITGGDGVRCRITLTGSINARPRARQLRMITT